MPWLPLLAGCPRHTARGFPKGEGEGLQAKQEFLDSRDYPPWMVPAPWQPWQAAQCNQRENSFCNFTWSYGRNLLLMTNPGFTSK